MGIETIPLGDHKLNTTGLERLANDLIQRLDVNIRYGYDADEKQLKLLDSSTKEGYIWQGEMIKNKGFRYYYLLDNNYVERQLLQKYGSDIFYDPDYLKYYYNKMPDKSVIEEEIQRLEYPDYSLEGFDVEAGFMHIYQGYFVNEIPYYGKWEIFCNFFLKEDYKIQDYSDEFISFRRELLDYLRRLGGHKMFYLSALGDGLRDFGNGGGAEMTWNELETYLVQKTSSNLLNIPLFLSDEAYRKKFLSQKKYPLAFVDDFRDII